MIIMKLLYHVLMLKTTLKYANQSPLTKYYILIILILDIIVDTYSSDLMVKIASGNMSLIPQFLIISYITSLIKNIIFAPICAKITNTIREKCIIDNYNKYEKLHSDDIVTRPFNEFFNKLVNYSFAIMMTFDWGFSNIIFLSSTFCSITWTFFQKGLIIHLSITLLIFSVFYYYYIRNKQNMFTLQDKKIRQERERIKSLVQLLGLTFEKKEISSEIMINEENKMCENDLKNELEWINIMTINNLSIGTLKILIVYFGYMSNNLGTFLLISLSMNRLSEAISELNRFVTQYNRYNNDYENMIDFWDGAIEESQPEKYWLSNQIKITVTGICIPIGNNDNSLKLSNNFNEINSPKLSNESGYISSKIKYIPELVLEMGMNILIEGPSGSGKSRLVKKLFDLIKDGDAIWSHGSGRNYYHCVVEYFQEIKEKMPSSKVSIRNYFRNESDNDVITFYLKEAWGKDYERIMATIIKASENYSTISMNNHPFDLPINEKLSGGQKSRLIFWTRGYVADYYSKECIILDEPMPDVDFDGYIDNITRFFTKYSNQIIIMVGHLCECKRIKMKNNGVHFDMELWVENGVIHRTK